MFSAHLHLKFEKIQDNHLDFHEITSIFYNFSRYDNFPLHEYNATIRDNIDLHLWPHDVSFLSLKFR